MFINFLIFYVMQITDKTNLQAVNMSWKVPVFLFCFSPYCGHCKSVHPFWTQMSEDLKDDPKVIAAELDCVQYNSICTKYYKVNSYPTFFSLLKGEFKKEEKLERTYEGLTKRAQELKRLNMDELCNKWNQSDIPTYYDEYPLFVLNYTENMKKACSFIEEFCKTNKLSRDIVYALPNQTELGLTVYFDNETYIKMDSQFKNDNILSFITEYQTKNFEQLKWDKVLQKKRAVAILVLRSESDLKQYKPIVTKYNKKYYFSYIIISKFRTMVNKKFTIDDSSLPAVFISNDKKTKYILKTEISTKTLKDELEKEFNSFKGIKNKKLSKIFKEQTLINKDDTISRLTLVAIALAIAAIIVIAGFFLTNDMSFLKLE